jgi:hypothetical protein
MLPAPGLGPRRRRGVVVRRRPRCRWLGNERGAFLLLEVVVATFLLALAVIPIFMGLTAVLMSMEKSVGTTVATSILQDRVEKMKAVGYYGVGIGLDTIGDAPTDNYYQTGLVVFQEILFLSSMTSGGTSTNPLGKKVILVAYRKPFTEGADHRPAVGSVAVARWEFILYADGI